MGYPDNDRVEALPEIYGYWGKAGRGAQAAAFHLLPYHGLDVAAVGHLLLQRHHRLRRLLADHTGLDEATLTAWFVWFLSLHDLGKFSYRFQAQRADLCAHLGQAATNARYTHRHDSIGWLLWSEEIGVPAVTAVIGRPLDRSLRNALDSWARTTLGHHGQPPKELTAERVLVEEHFTDDDRAAARHFADQCADLLLADAAPLPDDSRRLAKTLSPLTWWFAGIAVVCDWLGSGRPPNRYHSHPMPLPRYWHDHALPYAEEVLEQSGVLPLPSTPHPLEALFPYLHPPTPLQRHAADLPLPDSPRLYLLEDVTGAGKTEAALMLAHRLIAAGRADGLYFGLPTMATSNAIFRRVLHLAPHLFDGEPALILAHSASRLEGRDPLPLAAHDEADYAADEPGATRERGAWLRDSRKKALLADLGVGTIDQALLAVLHSRHHALRLLGLARKVLIVDEVHAYDSYMQQLLAELMTFQAAIGANVILLSATLPRAMRQTLAEAFARGLRAPPPALACDTYPLFTEVGQHGTHEEPLATRPQVARTLRIEPVHNLQTLLDQLLETSRQGRCGCWIRNTVAEAIEGWRALQAKGIPAEQLDLFHARFTLHDRLDREQRITARFGPDSGRAQRAGQILVSTQVVEQSLDLDFDLLVTDLAPIDLIIQRAGRLRRHLRDAEGNRADSEGRGPVLLYLHTPVALDDPPASWMTDFSPGSARVYIHHGHLWLTARLLCERRAFTMPEDARLLIEGVYGREAEESIPAGLQRAAATATGNAMAQRAVAHGNSVRLEAGYAATTLNFWDDAQTPTRLGDPTTTVRLARWDGTHITPWHDLEQFPWELSQVGVRESLIKEVPEPDDAALRVAIADYTATVFDQGRWSRLVVLRQMADGRWSGEAVNGKGEQVRVWYDPVVGLRTGGEAGPNGPASE